MSEKEADARREDEVLRRMLNTPPKPHKSKPSKRPKPKKEAPEKRAGSN